MTRRWFLDLSYREPETFKAGLAIQKIRDHTLKRWEFSVEGFRGVVFTTLIAIFVIFVVVKPEMLTSAYWIEAALLAGKVLMIFFPVACLLAGIAGTLFWSMWNNKVIELKTAANADLEKQWHTVKQFYSEPKITIGAPQRPEPEPTTPVLPVQTPVPLYGTTFADSSSSKPHLRVVQSVDDVAEATVAH